MASSNQSQVTSHESPVVHPAVIGLEIHVQLRTRTKLFCGCAPNFGDPPNSAVCPVCLGLPGALPVLNAEAVALGVRAALCVGASVQRESSFDRKSYFYPDLPKGYQITQQAHPLALGGGISIESSGRMVKIMRVHIEEDAGKSLHGGVPGSEDWTCLDFNRSGVPLAEIVTAPDLTSPEEAAELMRLLWQKLTFAGVTTGRMEEGALRCDANISVGGKGRSEIKNLNSFRFVEKALAFEASRLAAANARGAEPARETRLFDPDSGETFPLRGKEALEDYRYFPEPDLPPLVIADGLIEEQRHLMGEQPEARRERFERDFGLSPYDAGVLTAQPEAANYFEAAVTSGAAPKAAANWVMSEVLRAAKAHSGEWDRLSVQPEELAFILGEIASKRLTNTFAKELFAEASTSGRKLRELILEKASAPSGGDEALRSLIEEVLKSETAAVGDYRAGKQKAFGFLVGAAMKKSGGKADPAAIKKILEEKLKT